MPLLILIGLDVIIPLSWFGGAGDSGADLVEFKALKDPGVGHTIEGLLVVDPGRGEITAHLLKGVFC